MYVIHIFDNENIFNRPGVARAVLQTPLWLIISVSESAFSSKSSKYHKSQTVRARDLKFWENVQCYQKCPNFGFCPNSDLCTEIVLIWYDFSYQDQHWDYGLAPTLGISQKVLT